MKRSKRPGRPRVMEYTYAIVHSIDQMEPAMQDKILAHEEKFDELFVESQILNLMRELDNDKQRIVFLVLLLRESGFNLDFNSVAESMGIGRRWLMRIKAATQDILRSYTNRV